MESGEALRWKGEGAGAVVKFTSHAEAQSAFLSGRGFGSPQRSWSRKVFKNTIPIYFFWAFE